MLSNSTTISPNPAFDKLHVASELAEADFTIFDISGRSIMSGKLQNNYDIDISTLKSGVYAITISNSVPIKFIKVD